MAKGCGKALQSRHRRSDTLGTSSGGKRPCAVCGRQFASDRLVKHQAICRRNADNENQRRKESPPIPVTEIQAINSNWRDKRDEMKRQIKSSKPRTDVEFELVLKPQNEAMTSGIVSGEKPQEMVIVPDDESCMQLQVLDDSLDAMDDSCTIQQQSSAKDRNLADQIETPSLSNSENESQVATALTVDWSSPRKMERLKTSPKIRMDTSAIDKQQSNEKDQNLTNQTQATPLTDPNPVSQIATAWTVDWSAPRKTERPQSAPKTKLDTLAIGKQQSNRQDRDLTNQLQSPSLTNSENESSQAATAWALDWPISGKPARPKSAPKVQSSSIPKPPARWIESGTYKGMNISESFYAPTLDLTSKLPSLPNFSPGRIRFN